MTDTTGKPISDNENNSLRKGRLKLVTKLFMDNKYELMDDLNYSRTTTQNTSMENYFMNDNYMNRNGLNNSNHIPSPSRLSQFQSVALSSLPSTSSSYLSLLPFMAHQEEDKMFVNNNNSQNSGYNSRDMNKALEPNTVDIIPNQIPTEEFKKTDIFNFDKPLFIPKSTRLKAERVRIYLDYYYNVLERCISLDNNHTTHHYHHPNSPVDDIPHTHRYHYHEGVEGVYNPLQVIRNRKLRKKYHSELKPLRELTFTKVPLIAVIQFSNKPNRKLKWFVELSEKYSDLTWRTSHWNELRRPDGRRWIEDPKYNNLLNRPTDTSLNNSSNYESIYHYKQLKNHDSEADININNSSNTSLNYQSNNNEILSKSSHKRRSKIKKNIEKLKNIDNSHSLSKKDKVKGHPHLPDNSNNQNDSLSNNTKKNPANFVSDQKEFSSSTNSVNIINQFDSNNNASSVEDFNYHKDQDNFTSALRKVEKVLNKTKPKKLYKSPKRLNKRTKSTSGTTNDKIKPDIVTVLPTPTIKVDSNRTYDANDNDDSGHSNSYDYLKLPNKSDKNKYNTSPNSSKSNHLLSNSNDNKSSISLSSLSSYASHISLKLHRNHKNTNSNATNKDKSDKSGDISSDNEKTSSNLVTSATGILNTPSNVPSTSLSSDSSSDSSESSLILNVNTNNRRHQRRKSVNPIALQEDVNNNSNKPTFSLTNSNKMNNNGILKSKRANLRNFNYDRRNFTNNPNTFIDDQLDPNSSFPLKNSSEETQNSNNNVIIDEQLLQYWQDIRYISSTIAIMKHRRKTHDIVKKRGIQRRNETVKFEKDADYHIAKAKEVINKYDAELDKAIVIGNKWTSQLLNDYSIRVETLISSSDRILSDINTTLTLKLKLFQENTERFDNFKMVYSQRSTRLIYKSLEIFIIGILWTIWLLVITVKKIKLGIILALKVVKWMIW